MTSTSNPAASLGDAGSGVVRLTVEQLRNFGERGYIVVPNVVDAFHVDRARAELDRIVSAVPPPSGKSGNHYYFFPPRILPAAMDALEHSRALGVAEQLTAPGRLQLAMGHIQIALNIPPHRVRPTAPHIDGHVNLPPEQNAPDSFSLLLGLFLSDETRENSGNLWVWPGSHHAHARTFRERGVGALLPTSGQIASLAHAPELDEPVQVTGGPGDVLLAHFLLGHESGPNLGGVVRRMLYYRLECAGHGDRRSAALTDCFCEFESVRRATSRPNS